MLWQVTLTRQAAKDAKNLASIGLKRKAEKLFKVLAENPYQTPPEYEKLRGDLKGYFARRLTIQHRLVYEVLEKTHTVRIIRMWTHYE